MTFGQFFVSDVNPNDTMGGGGCICSPVKQIDCVGPYLVNSGNEMDSPTSPHVVVGCRCAERMAALSKGEVGSIGERHEIQFPEEPVNHARQVLPDPIVVRGSVVDDDEEIPEV